MAPTRNFFILCCALFSLQVLSIEAAVVGEAPHLLASRALFDGLKERVRRQGECPAELCFVLDGSRFLSRSDFQTVKYLAANIASSVGAVGETNFSAVHYGLGNTLVNNLTSDPEEFGMAVERLQYTGDALAYLAAGVAFCVRSVQRADIVPKKSNIVVLGSGQTSILIQFLQSVVSEAPRGSIYSIGVGSQKVPRTISNMADGDESHIFNLGRNSTERDVSNVVRGVTRTMCNLD